MAALPKSIEIKEEGPREGFQFEKGTIPTARKIELIDALSRTGVRTIQIVSFVNPKAVPGMADADEVVAGITAQPSVSYVGLWLNEKGLERAIATRRLAIKGQITMVASESFLKRNQNVSIEQQTEIQHSIMRMYKARDIEVSNAVISAAFGCNFEGDIPVDRVLKIVGQAFDIASEHGASLKRLSLMDTMGWATPDRVKKVVGAVQDRYPALDLALHLHDTRGMGIANAYAGLEMGVARYDASVAGLGGCPFAGHTGAAGNVCTEDLVFMCQEMGIDTGIDLEALCECARLAEDIVGHSLPGSVMKGGSLRKLRDRISHKA